MIPLQSKGLSRVFSSTTVGKHQFLGAQPLWSSMTTGKTIALTRWTFVGKEMSLLFNMLSSLNFSSKECLLISWLQSPFTVILEPKKIKSVTVSIVFPFKFSRLILKTDVLLSTSYKIHHVYFLMHIINTCNDFC